MRVHPLSKPHSLTDLSSYWALNMHDNHYGAVTCLATSFDDQFVLSGGEDGNLFVYKANLPTAAQRKEAAIIKVSKELFIFGGVELHTNRSNYFLSMLRALYVLLVKAPPPTKLAA